MSTSSTIELAAKDLNHQGGVFCPSPKADMKLWNSHPKVYLDVAKTEAMAKKLATDMGSEVADRALQLHGGYGYLADYGIEKLVRDLRVHQILEGTNEIMRLIVSRTLLEGKA